MSYNPTRFRVRTMGTMRSALPTRWKTKAKSAANWLSILCLFASIQLSLCAEKADSRSATLPAPEEASGSIAKDVNALVPEAPPKESKDDAALGSGELSQLVTSFTQRSRDPSFLGHDAEPIVRFIKDSLSGLADRLRKLHGEKLIYDKESFRKLGCIAVAELSLRGMKGVAAMFQSAFLARMSLSLPHMPSPSLSISQVPFLKPLVLSIHENSASDLPADGALNTKGECDKSKVGGRYDPGLACGPEGSLLCRALNIPPFDDLTGKRGPNATYQCNPTLYEHRPFSCHVGDLNGKYGPGLDASPSPATVDLRILASDLHADNPCAAGEQMLPLVIRSEANGTHLACSPFQILGSSPELVLSIMEQLVVETATALPSGPSAGQLLGALHASVELEKRVDFLQAAADKPPVSTTTSTPPPYTTSSTYSSTTTTHGHTSYTQPEPLPGPPTDPAPIPDPNPPKRPPRRRRPIPRPTPPKPPPLPQPERPPYPSPLPGPPNDPIPGPQPPHPPTPTPAPPPRRRRRRPWLPDDPEDSNESEESETPEEPAP